MAHHSLFMGFYLLLFGVFLYLMRALDIPFPESIRPFDFFLLSLATFRITELVTADSIAKFLRDPFVKREKVREPDGTVDVKVKPAGRGLKKAFGELIICPWCIGIWIGTFFTYLYILFPGPTRVLLLAVSVAAAGIIIELFAKLLDQKTDK
jgi:hypothetical protein